MYKFLLFIFILFLSANCLKAQDTIYKRSGDVVYAKVLEINPTEIKYKRHNFQDGPLYIERKEMISTIRFANGLKEVFDISTVSLQTVPAQQDPYYSPDRRINNIDPQLFNKIYSRGSKFSYKNDMLSENQLHRLLLKTRDKQIIDQVGRSKDAHTLQYIGFGAIPLGIGAIYFLQKSGFGSFYSYYGNSPNNGDLALSAVFFVGAITCPIVSGIFKQKRKTYNSNAIEAYNAKY
jgi:hypothetical protein